MYKRKKNTPKLIHWLNEKYMSRKNLWLNSVNGNGKLHCERVLIVQRHFSVHFPSFSLCAHHTLVSVKAVNQMVILRTSSLIGRVVVAGTTVNSRNNNYNNICFCRRPCFNTDFFSAKSRMRILTQNFYNSFFSFFLLLINTDSIKTRLSPFAKII